MTDFSDLHQLAHRARSHIAELSPVEARCKVAEGALLIDVRDAEELMWNQPLAGAVHLSRGRLEYLITDAVSSKDEPLVIYCAGGHRSVLAAASLRDLGYSHVYTIRGGLHAWRRNAGQSWFHSP